MADTDIMLSIDLDVKDAEKTAKDLQKEIEEIFKSNKDEQSASLTNLEIQMKKSYTQAQELQRQLLELSKTPMVPTEDFAKINEQLSETEHKIEELGKEMQQRYDRAEATGGYDASLNDLALDMANLEKEYDRLDAIRTKMMESGRATIPVEETEAYKNLEKQLDLTNDKLKQQLVRYSEIESREEAIRLKQEQSILRDENGIALTEEQIELEKLRQEEIKRTNAEMMAGNKSITALSMSIRGVTRLIPGLHATAVMGISMVTRGVMRLTALTKVQLVQALTALKAAFAKLFAFILAHPIILVFTAIAAVIIAIVKILKKWKAEGEEIADMMGEKLLDLLEKAKELAKDLISTLAKGFIKIGTLLPRAAVNVVSYLVDKLKSLKSIIQENLKLLAQWNDGVNDTNTALSNLTSSLNYLKGSIAAAFAPILTTVEPILTSLIDRLADVVNFVGMVIAKLSGATTYTKAVRVQTDYAKSLDKTAKSAKKANEQLASFDKLNVLNPNSGDSGSITAPTVDFTPIDLQETDLPDWIFNFEKLGATVSDFINDFLDIDWNMIQAKAETIGGDIADFLNGLDIGDALATTFGEGINTITKAVKKFYKKFKGYDFGGKLGKLIMDSIEKINWNDVGEMFSGGINELSLMIIGFTDKFEGSELGKAFSEFLSGSLGKIDWVLVRGAIRGVVDDIVGFLNEFLTEENFKLVGDTLGELLNTIFTGINVFADEAKWSEWGKNLAKGIEEFVEKTDFKMGAEAIHKLFMGLLTMIGDAVTELMEPENIQKITDAIVDFIKNLKFEEIGKKAKEISDKLIEGLKQIWQALKDSGALKEIIKMIVDLLQSKKDWEDMFKDFKTDIAKEVLKAKLNQIFGPVIDGIKGVLGELVDGFKYVWDQILDLFGLNEEMGYISGDKSFKGFKASDLKNRIKTKIPEMAEGGVLPPNKPFLAMVGDQKNGTNIEAPLATIEEAVANVVSNMGVKVVFDVKGDPNGIFKAWQREATVYYNQYNQSPVPGT